MYAIEAIDNIKCYPLLSQMNAMLRELQAGELNSY